MKNIKKESDKALDAEIYTVIESLAAMQPDTDDYTIAVKNLSELNKVREERTTWKNLKNILPSCVSLVSMALLLNFEKTGMITSKAFSILPKVRL